MKDVCIVFVGTKYSTKYVVQKRQQLDTKCSIPTRLTVLTDDPATVMGLGLRDTRAVLVGGAWNFTSRQLWWHKMFMFNDSIQWSGDVLYLDLDTIIVNDIAHFWTHEKNSFMICQDFNRKFIPDYPVSNSSVMRFTPGVHSDLYRSFNDDGGRFVQQFRGDQDYITYYFKNNPGKVWWPQNWCMSYKWEILHGGTRHGGTDLRYPSDYLQPDVAYVVPRDCSVVVYHGKPEPYDTQFGVVHTY